MKRIIFLLSLFLLLPFCHEEGIEGIGSPHFSLYPYWGGRGETKDVEMRFYNHTISTVLEIDMGEGIKVEEVTILGQDSLFATITIDEDTVTGYRDVKVFDGSSTLLLEDGFIVFSGSFTLTPDWAMTGEIKEIGIDTVNFEMVPGYTYINFGEGIDVDSFEISDSSHAVALISVDSTTFPGLRDVNLYNGPDSITLFDGFEVSRMTISAGLFPDHGRQGENLEIEVSGFNTHFVEGSTDIDFGNDIIVNSTIVLDEDTLITNITIANSATPGLRDVSIRTNEEGVRVVDGFEVIEVETQISDVTASFSFDLLRTINNTDGSIKESVSGVAYFYSPLNVECGTQLNGPTAYDQVVYNDIPEVEDCPEPKVFGAGEHVYFINDSTGEVITLDIVLTAGPLHYETDDELPTSSYQFGTTYSVEADGSEEENGVPAFRLDSIIVTPPMDFELLYPPLYNNYTTTRDREFLYQWTPANTYPIANMVSFLMVSDSSTGLINSLLSVPWDDGEHSYSVSDMSQLYEGAGLFTLYAYAEGPDFSLPSSPSYVSNATSSAGYLGYLIIKDD